jgi:hypothetical protein
VIDAMRATRRATRQLELRFPDLRRSGPSFVITSALERHRSRTRVETTLRYCLSFFPELRGHCFGVGVTRQALGLCSLEDFAIWLNPHGLSLHTVTHELTHLLQARGLVPNGERACDLHALARHPSLNDARPNYLDVPEPLFDDRGRTRSGWSGVLYESACRALEERSRGRRTYIRWFEDQVEELARASVIPSRDQTGSAPPPIDSQMG